MTAAAPGFYRFEAKIISRGGGRSLIASAAYRTGGKSATSAAAYRAGEQLTDERTGETYDYTKKRGIRGAEILLPEGALAWMGNRAKLWNAVEAAEKRKDAQLAKDYILSLPHELSPQQRYALTKWFVAEQFVGKGYVADIAWHSPDSREGLNHHAHVMVTLRKVEGDGFARTKDRPADGKHPAQAWKHDLMQLREAWAVTANRFLEAAGLDVRITHESLQTRGIDREADPKLGPVAGQIEAAGRESHAGHDRREVAERNAEREQLKAEHAAAVAEEARLTDLLAELIRRNALDDKAVERAARDMPELIRAAGDEMRRAEEAARAILRREAELIAQRIETFKTQAQRDEEKARREHDEQARAEDIRQRDGLIGSAGARYAIALGETADIDPLTNLVRAAGAESAAFLRQQEALRAQLSDPKLTDPQKQEIRLRKDIEFHEYQALTNSRLAGMYAVIGGDAHQAQAAQRTELAAASARTAERLRDERGKMLDAEKQREREATASKPQGRAQRAANQAAPPAAVNPRLSEARQAKLRQLDALEARYDQADAGRAPDHVNAPPASRAATGDEKRARDADDALRAKAAGRSQGGAGEMSDARQAKLAMLDAQDAAYDKAAATRQNDKNKGKDRGGGQGR